MRMASRKGFEPLTPGLGNLCSILLSYRDVSVASSVPAGACASGTALQLMIRSPSRFKTLDPGICRCFRRCGAERQFTTVSKPDRFMRSQAARLALGQAASAVSVSLIQ